MKKGLLIIILFSVFFVNAQPPSRFYTKFGGNGDDVAYSAKPTLDRQYIIAGSTSSYGSGNTDVYLVKLDSMGQIIWHKMFGGFGNDIGKSVIQLADSGYVIAGFTNSFGAGGYDAYLIKTDKNGNLIWQTTFGGLDWDFANDLVLGSDNNIYVTGYTNSFGAKDGFVVKYDLGGALLWQKYYGGTQNEELRSIIKTNDNFLAAAGYTESYGDILGDHYLLKVDLNGDTIFTKKFGNPGKSVLNDLVQYPNGDYILVGAETYTNLSFTQSYRAYTNSTANALIWQGNSFTSDDNEGWMSVTKSIFGSARTSTLRDFYKNGFKKQGNIFSNTWNDFYPTIVNEFGGNEDEHLYSNEGTKDGGFICVGSTNSFDSQGKDIFFIKLDSAIINYSTIVGMPVQVEKDIRPLIKVKESAIQIVLNSNHIPLSIEVFGINGEFFMKLENLIETIDIDKQAFKSSVYVFKFNYADNNSIVTKVFIH